MRIGGGDTHCHEGGEGGGCTCIQFILCYVMTMDESKIGTQHSHQEKSFKQQTQRDKRSN